MRFERHNRVKQVFLGAMEHCGAGLAGYLDKECGSDREVRRDVEALLAAHHDSTVLFAGGGIAHMGRPQSLDAAERFARLHDVLALLFSTRMRRMLAIAVIFVSVLAVGYWTRIQGRKMLLSQAGSAIRAVLDGNATALSIASVQWKSESRAVLDEPAVRAAGHALLSTRSKEAWDRFASRIAPLLSSQRYHSYFVISVAGEVIGTSAGLSQGRATASGMAAIGRMITRNGTTEFPRPGSDFGEPANQEGPWPRVVVLTPIRQPGGQVVAGFGLVRPIAQAAEPLRQGRPFQTGETYLFREDGLLISPSRFAVDLERWKLVSSSSADPKMASIFYLRDPGRALRDFPDLRANEDPATWPLTEVVRAATARRIGNAEPVGVILNPYRDYRGVEVVGAWRWIGELNVGLTTKVDAAEILAPLRFIDWPIGLLTVLLGGAGAWTILSSWFLTRLRIRTLAGEALGQYTLIEKLGEGGVGEVFLARHAHLRRPAAVKLLRRDRVSPAFLRQFELEAQAASSLRHPNSVAVYDFGVTSDGLPYYVMEYVPGIDLGQCVKRYGPMAPARAVHIARQICSALDEAHEKNILHRDIKPANVMLCELGGQHDFVKILDFGLAKDITSSPDETSHWERSGTPFYTAPERLLPNVSVDRRCDIYSLGVLVYFLVCGATPYDGGADWVESTLSADPIPPSKHVQIPPSLERVILDCMCREPGGRPYSAREVLERLSLLPPDVR
jgi:eukaryotic-like serine/threonine-protein kinase